MNEKEMKYSFVDKIRVPQLDSVKWANLEVCFHRGGGRGGGNGDDSDDGAGGREGGNGDGFNHFSCFLLPPPSTRLSIIHLFHLRPIRQP